MVCCPFVRWTMFLGANTAASVTVYVARYAWRVFYCAAACNVNVFSCLAWHACASLYPQRRNTNSRSVGHPLVYCVLRNLIEQPAKFATDSALRTDVFPGVGALVQSSHCLFMSPLRRHIFVCFMAKGVFFGPSSVTRDRTHSAWMKYVVFLHLYIP